MLQGINGKFILSLNDTPEDRALFLAFLIQTVQTQYTAAKNPKQKGKVQELRRN